MAQSFTAIFKDGQQYMQTWPVRKELFQLFPESKIVAVTKFSVKVMPPLAVLTVVLLTSRFGYEYLPQAIAMAGFFLSLPMQGLLWLGHRSNQLLPIDTKSWYHDIHRKMSIQGCALQAAPANPRYKELARLLKTAFDDLDRVFTKQWF
jgi:uncharacterized membrane protein YfbV (UPF0208 family)